MTVIVVRLKMMLTRSTIKRSYLISSVMQVIDNFMSVF